MEKIVMEEEQKGTQVGGRGVGTEKKYIYKLNEVKLVLRK